MLSTRLTQFSLLIAFYFNACSNDPSITNKKSASLIKKDSSITAKLDSFEITSYPYDTLLKSGYRLAFREDSKNYYLYLKKDTVYKEIASCSRSLPIKNLGYKVADFENYFALAHSFGSGNPSYIELIQKTTAKNILPEDAIWLGANEQQHLFAYVIDDEAEKNPKIILMNVTTQNKKLFKVSRALESVAEWKNSYTDIKITAKQLRLEYTLNGQKQIHIVH